MKSVNWRQSEIYIVIIDKSQGSIAKHLSSDRLLYYKFTTESNSEKILTHSVVIWDINRGSKCISEK